MNKSGNMGYSIKPYQELTFTDDYMFCKVLSNNRELCRRLVELLLDRPVERVEHVSPQYTVSITSDNKSVRFDVYLRDENGTVIDLEMQVADKSNLPKRSRYYQSINDIDHLGRGDDYDDLPDSIVIFICMFDKFNKGLPRYEFRPVCLEDTDVRLDDGTSRIFINATSVRRNISDEMQKFLDYLCGRGASSELTQMIDENIRNAKNNRLWEREYVLFEDKIKEARAEERTIAQLDDINKLVADGVYTAEKACEVLGVDIELYKEYMAEPLTEE